MAQSQKSPNTAEDYVALQDGNDDGLLDWLISNQENPVENDDYSLSSQQETAFLTEFLKEAGANTESMIEWVKSLEAEEQTHTPSRKRKLSTTGFDSECPLPKRRKIEYEPSTSINTGMIEMGDQQMRIDVNGTLRNPTGLEHQTDLQGASYTMTQHSPKKYLLQERNRRSFANKTAEEVIYDVKLGNDMNGKKLIDILPDLRSTFQEVIKEIRPSSAKDTDLVRIYVQHPDLRVPIVVSPRQWAEMDADTIMTKIQHVLTSKEALRAESGFEIHVGSISVPNGGARSKIVHVKGPQSCLVKKRSIVSIVNKDNLCLARSIVVGLAKLNEDVRYDNIRRPSSGLQRVRSQELQQQTGLSSDVKASLNEIHLFEDVVDTQIVVFSATRAHKPLYVGQQRDQRIYLYHTEDENGEGHYDTVTSITGCLGVAYFCHKCLLGYSNKKDHKCESICGVCRQENCEEGQWKVCEDCNRTCKSSSCYDNHKKNYQDASRKVHKSECCKYIMCLQCKVILERDKRNLSQHTCGEFKCPHCLEYFINDHLCYMKCKVNESSPLKHLYFDFECTQDSGEHKPNFVISQTVCDLCIDHDMNSQCVGCGRRCGTCDKYDPVEKQFVLPPCESTCGYRQVKFSGENTQNDFCEFLFSKAHKDFKVLAHNSRGYDAYFLLDFLIHSNTRSQIIPSIIYSGSKIMSLHVKPFNIKVIDSLNFLPMPLAKFPKAFGLKELKKGYFPHYFNTSENSEYVGPYPNTEYYGCDFMSPGNREAFLEWHAEKVRQNAVFDFRQELEQYCTSDVDILRRACLKFRSLMMNVTSLGDGDIGVDPFDNITIASTCMSIFQSKFLTETWSVLTESERDTAALENRKPVWTEATHRNGKFSVDGIVDKHFVKSPIGIVPPRGYNNDTFSKVSIQWLMYEQEKLRREGKTVRIQHALNVGEKAILGQDGKHYYRADGYYIDPDTNQKIVLEFYGDVVHGCPVCFPHDDFKTGLHPFTGQSMKQLYDRTMKREAYLRERGYEVRSIWECEFKEKMKKDSEMKRFVDSFDIQDRLDPRDAFFGGRTNGIKLHYKVKPGERIKYVDFTSLYPYINKMGKYNLGHPEVITDNFKNIEEYFGLAKVTILPPQDLYHPVLPYRSNNKLMFPLCRTCAENMSKSCQCSVNERCINGTWSTLEIQKAIEKGYVLLKIHEVYHFNETTQFVDGKGGLFSEYVNLFLKLKQQASGWPSWVKTEHDQDSYIAKYFENEGIQLDKTKIEINPALRSLAKLCLNSLWGKLGQKQNMTKTTIVNDGTEFLRLLFDQSVDISDFHILSENYAQIDWKKKQDFVESDARTNIFLAILTTAQARLKLYEVIDQLDQRVLYFDTDSVVSVSHEGDRGPPLGDYLGELTNELSCKEVQCPGCDNDHFITEFLTCGPKNYGYKVDNGFIQLKIRGFTLHYTNSQSINFDSMKDIILSDQTKKIKTTNPKKITRNKLKHKIVNKSEDKLYGLVYDKRVVLDNFDTVPYGYS